MITYDDVFSESSWCENENSLLAPSHSLGGGGGGGGKSPKGGNHFLGGGGGCDDYSPRNPQRGALPSLACPAEQDRYDIHSLLNRVYNRVYNFTIERLSEQGVFLDPKPLKQGVNSGGERSTCVTKYVKII